MTDNTFFDAPDDEPVQSRKSLLILGAVGGAVVLAAAGYFLLGGGGGGEDTRAFIPTAHRIQPVVAVARPTHKKPVTIPAVSKVRLGRDPFLALYVAPAAAVAGAGSPTTTGTAPTTPTSTSTTVVTPTKTTTTTTGTTTTGTTPTGTTPTGTTPSTTTTTTKHRFTIFGITGSASTGRARVSIDGGAPFTVHEGSIFGPNKEITITDIGLTVGVGEHVAFTLGEDPQPEMYAHESRLVP